MNTKSLEGIYWNFILGSTCLVVNSIVALADFLQGGGVWPCLLLGIGLQAVAVTGALR